MKKILCGVLATVMLGMCCTACKDKTPDASSSSNSGASSTQSNGIDFVNNHIELEIGQTTQLEVVTAKKNAFVMWTMVDPSIATVDETGMVTAKAVGETTCLAEAGGQTAVCSIKVKEKGATPMLSVAIGYAEPKVSLYPGKTIDLLMDVELGGEDVTGATVEYSVEDPQIATIADGKVTANAVGETKATITATYEGQTATTIITIKVESLPEEIKSITVSGQKTEFKVGDKFEFGGQVSVVYENGNTEENISYYNVDVSKFNARLTGTYEITVSVGDAEVSYTVTVAKNQKLRVLMIGNSFSQDTVCWLAQIAKDVGFATSDIAIGNLMIGGCTLETHYQNAQSNAKAYLFDYYVGGQWTYGVVGKEVTMKDGIRHTDWDFICLQQQSGNSGNIASYNSNLDGLIEYVKANAIKKDVKLVWNMTWAYPTGSGWFGGLYNNDQMTMYNSIVNAVQQKIVTNDNFCTFSPAGTAIQNGRTSYIGDDYRGDSDDTLDEWNRDGAHLSVYEGRFTSSLTMFCTLTGYMPNEISYLPPNVDEKEGMVIRESVTNALRNPFAVTSSQYKN